MSFMVKDCCFCVELRTGALIIGYLNLVESILLPFFIFFKKAAAHSVLGESLPSEDKSSTALIICLLSAFILLSLVLNILFLVGIQKNKPGYVKAYAVFLTIVVIFTFIAFKYNIVKGAAPEESVKLGLSIVIKIYFLVVIRSYHSKMLTPEMGPAIMDKALTERSNQNEQNVKVL